MYLDEMKIAPEMYNTIIPYYTKQNMTSKLEVVRSNCKINQRNQCGRTC